MSVLAQHQTFYGGFPDEELDFIIKYRMGRDAHDPQLKRTVRDGLQSLASNIESKPERYPPEQTPYGTPYHWADFILTTTTNDAHA